jgi:predicted transcriptional regulator
MSDKAFADAFGVSDKTISRALSSLEGKGFISRNTKNVQKGKERHTTANFTKIEAVLNSSTTDKMTLANETTYSTTDKMSVPQETICPLGNGQNDLIKDKSNKNNISKDNFKF